MLRFFQHYPLRLRLAGARTPRMYDFGDWRSRLSLAAMLNLAGRFDQHRF